MDLYAPVFHRPTVSPHPPLTARTPAAVAPSRVLSVAQLLNPDCPSVRPSSWLMLASPTNTSRPISAFSSSAPAPQGHGSGCLSAQACLGALMAQGYEREALVALRATPHAAIKLLALCRLTHELMDLGFHCAQLMAVVIEEEGEQTLTALALDTPQLMAMGFQLPQLVAIAGYAKGHHVLAAMLVYGPRLLAAQFSPEMLTRIAGHLGGTLALAGVERYLPALRAAGFSVAEITQVASRPGTVSVVTAMLKVRAVCGERSLPRVKLVEMTRLRSSAGILQIIFTHAHLIARYLDMAVVARWAVDDGRTVASFQARLQGALAERGWVGPRPRRVPA